jgi:hypothetical protein
LIYNKYRAHCASSAASPRKRHCRRDYCRFHDTIARRRLFYYAELAQVAGRSGNLVRADTTGQSCQATLIEPAAHPLVCGARNAINAYKKYRAQIFKIALESMNTHVSAVPGSIRKMYLAAICDGHDGRSQHRAGPAPR